MNNLVGGWIVRCECGKCGRRIAVQVSCSRMDKPAVARAGISACCASCLEINESFDQANPHDSEKIAEWKLGN